ncbi:hypothetical protein COBT_003358 [Conglomerata obtusa]
MQNINKLNLSDTSEYYSINNGGHDDTINGVCNGKEPQSEISMLTEELQKLRLNSSSAGFNFTKFDGKRKGRVAEIWIKQFEPYTNTWKSSLCYDHINANLTHIALDWFEGEFTKEYFTYTSFKMTFLKFFGPKQDSSNVTLIKKLNEKIELTNITEYCIVIRKFQIKSSLSFQNIFEIIKSKVPEHYQIYFARVEDWNTLFEATETISKKYKKKKYHEHTFREKSNTKDQLPNITQTKSIASCTYCKKPGHDIQECRKLKYKEKERNFTHTNNIDKKLNEKKNGEQGKLYSVNVRKKDNGSIARPRCCVIINGMKILGLVDTGADFCYMNKKKAIDCKLKITKNTQLTVITATGQCSVYGTANTNIYCNKNETYINYNIQIIEELQEDLILGIDVIRLLNINIYEETYFDQPYEFYLDQIEETGSMKFMNKLNNLQTLCESLQDIEIGTVDITEEKKEMIKELIYTYASVWRSDRKILKIKDDHKIDLIENFKISKCPLYRRSPNEHEIIESEIQKLLRKDYIVEYTSPIISPVVLVRKKRYDI